MGQGLSVLVVDDDHDARNLMLLLLEQMGHQADGASTVAEATGQLIHGSYDMVVLAYYLPDGTAGLFMHALKALRVRPRILLTSAQGGDHVRSSAEGWSLPLLSKPFTVQDFRQAFAAAKPVLGSKGA